MYTALVSGIFLPVSINQVYRILVQVAAICLHSAHAVLTGLFFTIILFNNPSMYFLITFFKVALYLYQKHYF